LFESCFEGVLVKRILLSILTIIFVQISLMGFAIASEEAATATVMMIANPDQAETSYILVERLGVQADGQEAIRFSVCPIESLGSEGHQLNCDQLGTEGVAKLQQRKDDLADRLKWAQRAMRGSVGVGVVGAIAVKRAMRGASLLNLGISGAAGGAAGYFVGQAIDSELGVPDLTEAQDMVDSIAGALASDSHIVVVSSPMSEVISSFREVLAN
jgi:hypothetical protein